MKNFSEFGIEISSESFVGDKIKVSKVLNREIIVHDFKFENSKFSGECLYLQIEYNNTKYLITTGSTGLSQAIKQVPKGAFPFKTTIVEENEWYLFT